MKTDYQYIRFAKRVELSKTSVWDCINKSGEYKLGDVKWNAGWRQYCYFPLPTYNQFIYSVGCLKDIAGFIEQLMAERKDSK